MLRLMNRSPRFFSSMAGRYHTQLGGSYHIFKSPDGAINYEEKLPTGRVVSGKLVEMADGWHHVDLGLAGGKIRLREIVDGKHAMESEACVPDTTEWLARVKATRITSQLEKTKEEVERCEKEEKAREFAMVTGEVHREGPRTALHFKKSQRPHPLVKQWKHPQVHHIWTQEELDELALEMKNPPLHKPVTIADHIARITVRGVLYNGFNFITRFNPDNPTVKACQWRLIILESVAAVPGMVAACLRHFRSLRKLERDHGWIYTLLEEAENERMHLMICLKTFEASPVTRFMVMTGQFMMTTFLVGTYIVRPKSLHRFVGYLEECACETYTKMIDNIETPGSHLNEGWKDVKAPSIARAYYRLDEDAMWVDALRCILADEAHHRDVNHTFADMKCDDPNPFIQKHISDARKVWEGGRKPGTGMVLEDATTQ